MNRIRVLSVEINVKERTPQEIETFLNKEIIRLENNECHVINIIPCGDNGFLILHDEPFSPFINDRS